MGFPLHFFSFPIDKTTNHEFKGYLESPGKTYVEYKGKKYNSLPSFVKDCSFLLTFSGRLTDVATLFLFLSQGNGYQVISNPQEFKDRYHNKIKEEKSNKKSIDPLNSTTARGVFDLSPISVPKIENEKTFIFFVEEVTAAATPKKAIVDLDKGTLELKLLLRK